VTGAGRLISLAVVGSSGRQSLLFAHEARGPQPVQDDVFGDLKLANLRDFRRLRAGASGPPGGKGFSGRAAGRRGCRGPAGCRVVARRGGEGAQWGAG